jgi:hypothetical protein
MPAEHIDGAEAGPQQPGQDAQQRRFAGAVLANQHIAAPRFKTEGYLAQCGK